MSTSKSVKSRFYDVDRLEETRFGFNWGPAKVERAMSDDKYGVAIMVSTPYRELMVWVSPGGRSIGTHVRTKRRGERK